MSKHFFDGINYSSCNEDPATELEALKICPGDNVACVTGSGDRPLHMLLGDPDHVFAFDINKAQNYLLELKIAAIKQLNYSDYLTFLGVKGDSQTQKRKHIYREIRKDLSVQAARWFDANLHHIAKGVLYSGRWERYFRLSSCCIRMWRGRKVEKLFTMSDIATQRTFVKNEWDTLLWRIFLKLSFNSLFFKGLLGDPGFYAQVENDFSAAAYVRQRMNNFLENYLANESFMMVLIFLGKFTSAKHYPPYLLQENYSLLQERINRVTIYNLSLEELFDSDLFSGCNKYSLSDVSSFLDRRSYKKVFVFLGKQPGRRFCLRDFLTNRGVPDDCPPNIMFYPALEKEMERKDRSIGYTFLIGETS